MKTLGNASHLEPAPKPKPANTWSKKLSLREMIGKRSSGGEKGSKMSLGVVLVLVDVEVIRM